MFAVSDKITYLWCAYDAITAQLIDESAKEGIWLSGLCHSAALGLPDDESVTINAIADTIKAMRFKTQLPILVDGDTGFGGGINLENAVNSIKLSGANGICIEDKMTPKNNSFLDTNHFLEDIDKFCNKLRIIKNVTDNSFKVVARTEALIAGESYEIALERSYKYAEAGADIIIIHDKSSSPENIFKFLNEWNSEIPIMLIPTSYPIENEIEFFNLGVRYIIVANQLLRNIIFSARKLLKMNIRDIIGENCCAEMIGHKELVKLFNN